MKDAGQAVAFSGTQGKAVMGESYQEEVERTGTVRRVESMRRIHLLAPVRAAVRFVVLIVWILACHSALLLVTPLKAISPPHSRKVRKSISRTWIKGMARIVGNRITVHGTPPKPPFFLVLNHLSWIDILPSFTLLDATAIAEEPVARTPFIGTLVEGFEPIFVRRVKEDTARVNDLMVKAIEAGQSVLIAPETPVTTIPRGRGVRQFRGGLLASAVRTGMPVHYFSVTYRTPEGYPPPSKVMLFGPNPFYRTPDGKIPESELAAWGPERSFLWHFLGVLALPWHEVIVEFAPEPIPAGNDRIALANRLHDAVERMYVPIE